MQLYSIIDTVSIHHVYVPFIESLRIASSWPCSFSAVIRYAPVSDLLAFSIVIILCLSVTTTLCLTEAPSIVQALSGLGKPLIGTLILMVSPLAYSAMVSLNRGGTLIFGGPVLMINNRRKIVFKFLLIPLGGATEFSKQFVLS